MTGTQDAQKCDVCDKAQSGPESKLLRCGRCKQAQYCSKECQSTAWISHKDQCTPSIPSFSEAPPQRSRKRVLLLELDDFSWLGDMYEGFHNEIRSACDYTKITKASVAVDQIAENPNVVVIFESSIMNMKKRVKHQVINQTLVAYAKTGGTVIFTCQCSNHVTPPSLDWYFRNVWDLPWKFGNYGRFSFALKMHKINGKQLPKEYNAKAVQLNDVDTNAVVYRQAGEAYTLTGMLPTPEDEGEGSGPVVWQKYGAGWVGWTGDVNNEKETGDIVRIMAGI